MANKAIGDQPRESLVWQSSDTRALLLTYIFRVIWTIDFEGHKLFWMFSNQVMALYRAVILFVGVV